MKKAIRFLLSVLLTLVVGTGFSQTTDSLSVFPNPFAVSTTIHFDLVQSDTITLRVYNSFGLIISSYYESSILDSGTYDINLNGDSLADGIYFVLLNIGSNRKITRKAIKVGATSRLEDIKTGPEGIIYPNPTTGRITIPQIGNKTILLTDYNGKLIKSITTDQKELSLSDLPTGQYLLSILANQGAARTVYKLWKKD